MKLCTWFFVLCSLVEFHKVGEINAHVPRISAEKIHNKTLDICWRICSFALGILHSLLIALS